MRKVEIQALVKEWSGEYAPGTVRNVVARIFAAAVEDRVLVAPPCKRIALPSMSDKEVVPPTVDEVLRIIGAIPDRYRAAAVVLAGTGLRIGELLALRPSDVLVPFKTLRVERQRLQSGEIGAPKSRRSRRWGRSS